MFFTAAYGLRVDPSRLPGLQIIRATFFGGEFPSFCFLLFSRFFVGTQRRVFSLFRERKEGGEKKTPTYLIDNMGVSSVSLLQFAGSDYPSHVLNIVYNLSLCLLIRTVGFDRT